MQFDGVVGGDVWVLLYRFLRKVVGSSCCLWGTSTLCMSGFSKASDDVLLPIKVEFDKLNTPVGLSAL